MTVEWYVATYIGLLVDDVVVVFGQPSLVQLSQYIYFLARPICSSLSWGLENIVEFTARYGDFNVILGADVVFWPAAIPLLFETVQHLLLKKVCLPSVGS